MTRVHRGLRSAEPDGTGATGLLPCREVDDAVGDQREQGQHQQCENDPLPPSEATPGSECDSTHEYYGTVDPSAHGISCQQPYITVDV